MPCKEPWQTPFCSAAVGLRQITSLLRASVSPGAGKGDRRNPEDSAVRRGQQGGTLPCGCQIRWPEGVLFSPEVPRLKIITNPFDHCSYACHTKAVSSCSSPLASLAPSAAWHSCSVSSSASGCDVSMMAMVSPSSVHMIVC